jgi:hypothetical protein
MQNQRGEQKGDKDQQFQLEVHDLLFVDEADLPA